jgi:hypothetical protein
MDNFHSRSFEKSSNYSFNQAGYGSKEAFQKARAFKEKFRNDNINGEALNDFHLPKDWTDANYVYKNKVKDPKNLPFYYGYYSSKWTKRFKQDDEIMQWIAKGSRTTEAQQPPNPKSPEFSPRNNKPL